MVMKIICKNTVIMRNRMISVLVCKVSIRIMKKKYYIYIYVGVSRHIRMHAVYYTNKVVRQGRAESVERVRQDN